MYVEFIKTLVSRSILIELIGKYMCHTNKVIYIVTNELITIREFGQASNRLANNQLMQIVLIISGMLGGTMTIDWGPSRCEDCMDYMDSR